MRDGSGDVSPKDTKPTDLMSEADSIDGRTSGQLGQLKIVELFLPTKLHRQIFLFTIFARNLFKVSDKKNVDLNNFKQIEHTATTIKPSNWELRIKKNAGKKSQN